MAGSSALLSTPVTEGSHHHRRRHRPRRRYRGHRSTHPPPPTARHSSFQGYSETANQLQREAGAPISRFAAADNIDLATVVREYEAFYEIKLGKKPKVRRRLHHCHPHLFLFCPPCPPPLPPSAHRYSW